MRDGEIEKSLTRWNLIADQWDVIESRMREAPRSLPTLRAYCDAANCLYADRSDTLYFIATTWPGRPDPDANVVLKRRAQSAAAWIEKVNQRLDRNIPVKSPVAIKTLLDLHITSEEVAVERHRCWPEDDAPEESAA